MLCTYSKLNQVSMEQCASELALSGCSVCCLQTGDELLISYIDETAPLSDRRNQLVEYGFECRCGRCCEEQAEDVNMPIHGNCD
jgi:hypothetical protein